MYTYRLQGTRIGKGKRSSEGVDVRAFGMITRWKALIASGFGGQHGGVLLIIIVVLCGDC